MEKYDSDLLVGVEEIGRFIGRSRRQTQHWIDVHHLPTFRVGRAVCAYKAAINAWLRGQARAQQGGQGEDGDNG